MHAVICTAREHSIPPALLPFHISMPSPQRRSAPPSHALKESCCKQAHTTALTDSTGWREDACAARIVVMHMQPDVHEPLDTTSIHSNTAGMHQPAS